jgi:hypothetical protein
MRTRRGLLLWAAAIVVGTLPGWRARAQEPAGGSLAALISELSGVATISGPSGRTPVQARRFDGLTAGMSLEMGPTSRGVVVLAGGQRFEFGPKARATFGASELSEASGPIAALPRLPMLPRIAALDGSRPQGPPASVRLRSERIAGLSPFHAIVLGKTLTLRFTPVRGASRYAVEIESADGRRIAGGETTSPAFVVPAGVLEPGATYVWTVQTVDKIGDAARGAARFTTLSIDDVQARAALRAAADTGASESLALLAEVDRRLELYPEALAGFRAALKRAPKDRTLLEAIRDIEGIQAAAAAR